MDKLNWNSITYRDYLKIAEFQKDKDTFISNTISLLFNCNAEQLPIADYLEKSKELSFLGTDIPKVKMCKVYKINGTEYDLNYMLTEFTAGQFFDYTNYLNKPNSSVDILSVIMIPKGHKYNDGYDLNKVREDILSMRLVDILAVNTFFLRSLEKFINLLILSLRKEMETMNLKEEERVLILNQINKVGEYCHI